MDVGDALQVAGAPADVHGLVEGEAVVRDDADDLLGVQLGRQTEELELEALVPLGHGGDVLDEEVELHLRVDAG